MTVDVLPDGNLECLYTEALDLSTLGTIIGMRRASNIEFDVAAREWVVTLPAGGELFRDKSRDVCLQWEHDNQEVLLAQGNH